MMEYLLSFLILAGAIFTFIGSLGLARLRDFYTRLHGPTKATTLGIGALLVASMIYFVLLRQAAGIHEVLISLFLFLTAPVSANMIAKAHIFRNKEAQGTLPPDATHSGWATLQKSPGGTNGGGAGGDRRGFSRPGSSSS